MTHDEERSDWLSTAVNEETVNIMRAILKEDCCYTLDDFHHKMMKQYSNIECRRTSMFNILTNELEMRKVCVCWIPQKLLYLHWKERMGIALEFLTMNWEEGDALFDCIITGDETWVHYWMPKSKAVYKQWKHKDEKALKKFKKTASTGKVMVTVFWDWQRVLLVKYLPRSRT